jgi:hypothetical protein
VEDKHHQLIDLAERSVTGELIPLEPILLFMASTSSCSTAEHDQGFCGRSINTGAEDFGLDRHTMCRSSLWA